MLKSGYVKVRTNRGQRARKGLPFFPIRSLFLRAESGLKGPGFTGEMLNLLDRDTRGRSTLPSPSYRYSYVPFLLYLSSTRTSASRADDTRGLIRLR